MENLSSTIPNLQTVLAAVANKVDARKLEQLKRKLELALDCSLSAQAVDDPIVIRRHLVDYMRRTGARPGMIQATEQFYMGVIRRAALEGLIPAPPEGPWSRRWQSVLDALAQASSTRFLLRSLAGWATARGFEPHNLSVESITTWAHSAAMDSGGAVATAQSILEKWKQDPVSVSLVSDSFHIDRLRKKALRGSVRFRRARPRLSSPQPEKDQLGLLYEIHYRLRNRYNTPDLGNVGDVFGEIIFALLSTRTAVKNYDKAFSSLRKRFPDWVDLAHADIKEVSMLLEPCGLHNRKAEAIVTIARRVFVDEGLKDLEHLRNTSTTDAESYLRRLPEVGVKVAKCVCLYALDRQVFPLDAHNLRILKRLGLADKQLTAREGAYIVESLIPEEIRHDLHVNLIAHGRQTCLSNPRCSACVLLDLCPYPKEATRDA